MTTSPSPAESPEGGPELPAPKYQHVQIIVNPAAGQDVPVLGTFNRMFVGAGIKWDMSVTHEAGDAQRLTKEAVKAGADLIAAYGGDGTVMEVATALIGSDVPMAILPGGTANIMALELGVPTNLEQACALICTEHTLRAVDIGRAGEHNFLVRIGCGFEAAMIEGADRETKNRLGWLAYALSALQALREPQIATYRLTLDGKTIEEQGLTCIVANSGILGRNMTLAPDMSVSDGLLDVIVVRPADLGTLVALAANVMTGNETGEPLQHWQAHEVTIEADPPQSIQCDGEMIGSTPIDVKLLPQAVRMVVPVPPATEQPAPEPAEASAPAEA